MTVSKAKKSSAGKGITATAGSKVVVTRNPQKTQKVTTVRPENLGPTKAPLPPNENERPFAAVGSSNLAAARALLQIGTSKSSLVMQNLTNQTFL